MARVAEQKGNRRSVIVAVAATFVVCLIGHLAYNRFVLAREQAPKADEPLADSEGSVSEKSPPRPSGQNGEVAAALLRAVAKAAEDREACTPSPAPTEEEKAKAERARDDERLSEQARRYMKANVETLEEELGNEKVDAEWARKTEEAARRAVASTRNGMRLDDVTCRTTFCRARVTHVDSSMRGSDVMDLVALPEIAGQVLPYAPDDDGETTVIYFAREGHTLSVMSSGPPPSAPPSGTAPPKSDVEPPVKVVGG